MLKSCRFLLPLVMPLSTYILIRSTIADLVSVKRLLIPADQPPLEVIGDPRKVNLVTFCTINQKGLYFSITTSYHNLIISVSDFHLKPRAPLLAFTLRRRSSRSAAFVARRARLDVPQFERLVCSISNPASVISMRNILYT